MSYIGKYIIPKMAIMSFFASTCWNLRPTDKAEMIMNDDGNEYIYRELCFEKQLIIPVDFEHFTTKQCYLSNRKE